MIFLWKIRHEQQVTMSYPARLFLRSGSPVGNFFISNCNRIEDLVQNKTERDTSLLVP
jgi:hypothetical protein